MTGSRHLVTAGRDRVLLDCGLFQGLKDLRLRNWKEPDFPPAALSAVVLSHAHLDHSGYLPLLVKRGFRGAIYCTRATAELTKILLRDSAHLQEEDAERANRYGYTRHHPALPLYTEEDAERAIELLDPRPFHEPFPVTKGIRALFRLAGHILGAATVELQIGSTEPGLVYSGDLGRPVHPYLRPPDRVSSAPVLVLESTYGDRRHPDRPEEQLARVIREAAQRGGALIIPSFAVGRAQELIWIIRRLEDAGLIPLLPLYLDSPMAIDVTEMTSHFQGNLAVDPAVLRSVRENPLLSRKIHFARTPMESRAINDLNGPVIIISASGMATGGRVLHHLRLRLPDPRTTVLFPGFQAAGTRGRALQEGALTVKMHGSAIPVRARIETLDGLSAHADSAELLDWLSNFEAAPRHTYLVHGEPGATAALAQAIQARLGWPVQAARDRATVAL